MVADEFRCDDLRRSAAGQSGLELVLGQVAKQLEPSDSEAGGLFVGDLVIHLLRKAGPAVGPVLPDLLKAIVNRLSTAQTAMFTQVSSLYPLLSLSISLDF